MWLSINYRVIVSSPYDGYIYVFCIYPLHYDYRLIIFLIHISANDMNSFYNISLFQLQLSFRDINCPTIHIFLIYTYRRGLLLFTWWALRGPRFCSVWNRSQGHSSPKRYYQTLTVKPTLNSYFRRKIYPCIVLIRRQRVHLRYMY